MNTGFYRYIVFGNICYDAECVFEGPRDDVGLVDCWTTSEFVFEVIPFSWIRHSYTQKRQSKDEDNGTKLGASLGESSG